ncbi:MAG: AMP-binding protein, partial [Actinobacteria bacterium]|nr:AMP-binding protein [Actinomycetota bacterium]
MLERSDTGAAGTGYPTVAARVRDWATRTPDQVCMREKDFGIWQEITWRQCWDTVLDAAHGLLALGVEPGDRVSIHSEDRPEWIILDMATVAVRGITIGLYPTNPAAEVEYLLDDSGSVVHFAEDQEQVDKVLELPEGSLPQIRRIIYVEDRGVRAYDDEHLLFWDDFLAMGREHRSANEGAVERLMAEAEPDDVMTLVYTSGTTGPPKGAMLTNANA